MSFLGKSFLVRRRIDSWVLAVASAAMPIRLGLGPILLFVFSSMGSTIGFLRQRARTHIRMPIRMPPASGAI